MGAGAVLEGIEVAGGRAGATGAEFGVAMGAAAGLPAHSPGTAAGHLAGGLVGVSWHGEATTDSIDLSACRVPARRWPLTGYAQQHYSTSVLVWQGGMGARGGMTQTESMREWVGPPPTGLRVGRGRCTHP